MNREKCSVDDCDRNVYTMHLCWAHAVERRPWEEKRDDNGK